MKLEKYQMHSITNYDDTEVYILGIADARISWEERKKCRVVEFPSKINRLNVTKLRALFLNSDWPSLKTVRAPKGLNECKIDVPCGVKVEYY